MSRTGNRPKAQFVTSNSWGHIFVGKREEVTRWVYDKTAEKLVAAQIKSPGTADQWTDLSRTEAADLLESIHHNDALDDRAAFDLVVSATMPEWAAIPEHTPGNAALTDEYIERRIGHRLPSSGFDAVRSLIAESVQLSTPSLPTTAQPVTSAGAVIAAFLYVGSLGSLKLDFDSWNGHTGFVESCVVFAQQIANFLDQRNEHEFSGVVHYELVEPLGRWLVEQEQGSDVPVDAVLAKFEADFNEWMAAGETGRLAFRSRS